MVSDMSIIEADEQIDKYLQLLDHNDLPYVAVNDIDDITLDGKFTVEMLRELANILEEVSE